MPKWGKFSISLMVKVELIFYCFWIYSQVGLFWFYFNDLCFKQWNYLSIWNSSSVCSWTTELLLEIFRAKYSSVLISFTSQTWMKITLYRGKGTISEFLDYFIFVVLEELSQIDRMESIFPIISWTLGLTPWVKVLKHLAHLLLQGHFRWRQRVWQGFLVTARFTTAHGTWTEFTSH